MKRTYYLFNAGRLTRKDDTLKFTPTSEDSIAQSRYIPIETVENLYTFGSLDANSSTFNFLGKNQINVHFFDYYEHYSGSFFSKEYLLSGKLLLKQCDHYQKRKKRIQIAQQLLLGATHNILKNMRYYNTRGRDLQEIIHKIEGYSPLLTETTDVDQLMGIEGNIRVAYYQAFDEIIEGFEMGNRTKRPPSNEVNAMISFVNSLCYTLCLDSIYHTQLNPTISYLHQPGERRFSLALDLSEIFKPLLVDRLIFAMFNRKQLQKSDFEQTLNGCTLKHNARKRVVEEWEKRLSETIKHRTLNRSVSYKQLVRLECYKLVKHILDIEDYRPFKIWW